ncbi:hypothetical protein SAMN04488556_0095 [Halostagnicola kamekurae]|uniref:Uncharacterized protein n=1 Tax=Halostagnicola kamekurae TaxID=619731 RepID=A0A1I6V7A4_9EURY|nr:hypothetical protein SAMN04488556_0095 [Halostagnicola kamekurae]
MLLTSEQWLVLVTLAYVVLTFQLVKETKKAREDDRQQEINRQKRE